MTKHPEYYSTPTLTAEMREHLGAGGRALLSVTAGGDTQPAFTVTVGNCATGYPELLTVGTDDGAFLCVLTDMMEERGRPFTNGERVMIAGHKFPFLIMRMGPDTRRRFLALARAHYGHDDFAAMLVLTPVNFPIETVPVPRLHLVRNKKEK